MENGKKMTQEQFNIKFFTDMQVAYSIRFEENGICQFSRKTSDVIHVDFFSRDYLYQQYQAFNSYQDFKEDVVETLEATLNMYIFKIDMSNVMPIVKEYSFRVSDINFIRDEVKNADLDFLYIQDTGSVYKFISDDDLKRDKISAEELKKRAWSNLNKIVMPLLKLEEDVFCICGGFDNTAILAFEKSTQQRIERKLKTKDWIFSIPSSSNLFVAKFNYFNIGLLGSIQKMDSDINKITDTIYRMKDGVLSTVNLDKSVVREKTKLSLV